MTFKTKSILLLVLLVVWTLVVSVLCPLWAVGLALEGLAKLVDLVRLWNNHLIPFYYRVTGVAWLCREEEIAASFAAVERVKDRLERFYEGKRGRAQ